VGRIGAAIVGMELAALIVAVLAFGWPVLLVGAPLLVGTLVALAVVRVWELVRRGLERRRSRRWDQSAALPDGLMSGFFEVASIGEQPALPPVDVPILRTARGWAEGVVRGWAGGPARTSVDGALRSWVAGAMPGRAPVSRPPR
jgi:hypothetical protein